MRRRRNWLPEHSPRYSPCAQRLTRFLAKPVSFWRGSSPDPEPADVRFARERSRLGFLRKAVPAGPTSEQLFPPTLVHAVRSVERWLRSLVVTPDDELLIGSDCYSPLGKVLPGDIALIERRLLIIGDSNRGSLGVHMDRDQIFASLGLGIDFGALRISVHALTF